MPVEAKLADFLAASGDMAYEWDMAADRIEWFGAWTRLFAAPPRDRVSLARLIHDDDRHLLAAVTSHSFDRQFRIVQGASILWIHERGACDMDGERLTARRGVWRIVDQPAHLLSPAEVQNRDSLTGCLKRRALITRITQTIEQARIARHSAACLVIGVDRMSFVNETIGTEGGDTVLRSVAARLGQIAPPQAMIGRVSGDVFGILLPEAPGDQMEQVAARIVQDFRNAPVIACGTPMHITVSIGGVRIPQVANNAQEAMIFAEQALHMARQKGHNNFVEYIDSPARARENRRMLELSEQIKQAFKQDGFRLAYQPIVDAATGSPLFYEVLVRMFDAGGTVIPAAQFVPMIEQMGLSFDLDRKILDLAIRDMEAEPHLNIAINVSGLTASQADWPGHIRSVLEYRRPIASRLVFEITETAAIVDIDETKRFVTTARDLGARVALDDFGAGATSIRYLRELAISIMKIDKELLIDLTTNHEQQHVLRILIDLARGLGIRTVAEGIEDHEVASWMRGAGVDYMQGYHFGRPDLQRPKPVRDIVAAEQTVDLSVLLGLCPMIPI